MSVGPVGPGGGIYSIIEDVVCKEYFLKTDLEAKQSGQFCICLWALSGPELGYIQIYGMLCTKYITKKRISRPNRSVCFYEDRNILPKCVYLHAPSSGPTLQ